MLAMMREAGFENVTTVAQHPVPSRNLDNAELTVESRLTGVLFSRQFGPDTKPSQPIARTILASRE